jgi:methionyl-tRNA formyltransferase
MNLVVLSSCSPANACLINLIERQHGVRHVFRVNWTTATKQGTRLSKFVQSPVDSVVGLVRRKFFERIYDRIEQRAAEQLLSEGIPPRIAAPVTNIDARHINSPAFARALGALDPDALLVSACPLLKSEIFEIPRLGTINVHRGIAPFYRGERTIFWPLYYREFDKIGVTLHRVDSGTDTGPILGYGFPQLQANDTESSILAKCMKAAAELVNASLASAETSCLKGTRQTVAGKCFYRRDQRIWKDIYYLVAQSLGQRSIPEQPQRIELLHEHAESVLASLY